jgi:integrase
MQRIKDIFVFGCTVGLRYSDLMRLKKQNIQYTGAGTFLILSTFITSCLVKINLPGYISSILIYYKRISGRFVLPRLSNVNLNLQVKTLIEKAGWVYNLPKIRHRQGKLVEIKNNKGNSYRFCDHITTHTMRRTAITTLLMMGVPEAMVRKISGHAAGSKEFYKYVCVVQDYMNEKVKFAFDKLLSI